MHCESPSTKSAAPHFIDVMSLPWWGSNFHNLHHKTNETSTVAFNPKDQSPTAQRSPTAPASSVRFIRPPNGR
ncbi:hypothetical protein ACQKWADRAFT_260926 [Trichoderma austrokoningii]